MSQAIVVKHKYTIKEENDEVKVFWSSPCAELRKIMPPYPKLRSQCNFDVVEAAVYKCQKHYQSNWINAVYDLYKCKPRMKRGITEVAKKTVISAATNLLKSIFTNQENNDLTHKVKNEYNINNNIDISIMRDTITNTNFNQKYKQISDSQPEQEDVKSNQVPREVYGNFMVHQAIAFKSKLVRKIARSCNENSQLDTHALATLIEDDEILAIPKNATTIRYIDLKPTETWFRISFDVNREIEIEATEDIDNNFSLIFIGSMLIIFIIFLTVTGIAFFYYVKTITRLNTEPHCNPPQEIELKE